MHPAVKKAEFLCDNTFFSYRHLLAGVGVDVARIDRRTHIHWRRWRRQIVVLFVVVVGCQTIRRIAVDVEWRRNAAEEVAMARDLAQVVAGLRADVAAVLFAPDATVAANKTTLLPHWGGWRRSIRRQVAIVVKRTECLGIQLADQVNLVGLVPLVRSDDLGQHNDGLGGR